MNRNCSGSFFQVLVSFGAFFVSSFHFYFFWYLSENIISYLNTGRV